MAKSARRRRVKIQGVIRLLIFIALLIYFIVKLVEWNSSSNDAYYKLSYSEIKVVGEYPALIIRNEVLLEASASGKITQVEDDGARVKVNQRILDITGTGGSDDISNEQVQVDQSHLEMTLDEMDAVIEQLKVEIAQKVRAGDFEDVDVLSENLAMKLETKNTMTESNSENKILTLGNESLLEGEKAPMFTSVSGILTYYIDGYENIFQYDNISNIKFDEVEKMALEPYIASELYVNAGDVVGKIVQNTDYYLLVIVGQNEYNQFDINRDIVIEVADKSISGTIEQYISTGNKVAIALHMDQQFTDYYKQRRVDVRIKQETYKGLSIEKSSLIKTDDGYAVYVVNKLNKVQEMPVKIIQYYDERAIVKSDFFYEFVNDEKSKIETVSVYDKVILNQEDYKVGDIIK